LHSDAGKKAMTAILTVLAASLMIASPQATASEVWMLAQVNADGLVLSNLGAFSSKEACMSELAKEKAAGIKGLECRSSSSVNVPQPSAPSENAQPQSDQDPIFGKLNVKMLDSRGCPARWNPTRGEWQNIDFAECAMWKWLQGHRGQPGPWYLVRFSGASDTRQLVSAECIAHDQDGNCWTWRREFIVTTTYTYSLLGTFDLAEKCVVANKEWNWSGQCQDAYTPVRIEQRRDFSYL
jgi:hypothetical protein